MNKFIRNFTYWLSGGMYTHSISTNKCSGVFWKKQRERLDYKELAQPHCQSIQHHNTIMLCSYSYLFLLQRGELAACRSGGGRRVVKTEGRPGLQPRPRGMRPWPAQQPIHVLPLHMDVTPAPPSHAPAPPSTRLPSALEDAEIDGAVTTQLPLRVRPAR